MDSAGGYRPSSIKYTSVVASGTPEDTHDDEIGSSLRILFTIRYFIAHCESCLHVDGYKCSLHPICLNLSACSPGSANNCPGKWPLDKVLYHCQSTRGAGNCHVRGCPELQGVVSYTQPLDAQGTLPKMTVKEPSDNAIHCKVTLRDLAL